MALFTFTKEVLNGELYFLCSVSNKLRSSANLCFEDVNPVLVFSFLKEIQERELVTY